MAALTVARFIIITDALAAVMLSAKGASANGLGDNDTQEPSDDFGARGRAGDLWAAIQNYDEDDYTDFQKSIKDAYATMGYQTWAADHLDDILGALDDLCADTGLTGVTSATSFASSSNYGANADTIGSYWTCLVAPDFGRGVYYHVNGSYMEARNVYSPAVSNMASRSITSSTPGTFTAGTDVDSDKYAGAARLQAVIGSFSGSAGTLIVTGNGRDSNGAAITGRTWTVTVSASTTYTLTPTNAGDICYKVTAIQHPGTMTDGTVQINAAIPSGRSNPPT